MTTQEHQLTEAPEPEVEYSQEQQQEPEPEPYKVANPEQDLTNPDNPQGNHRRILNQYHTSVKLYFIWSVHLSL